MTAHGLIKPASYAAVVGLCAVVVGATFQLFVLTQPALALLALVVGSVMWGIAAAALRISGLTLPAIALLVELAVAFEFKRTYVLDYVGGAPRSTEVFMESIFLSDLFLVAAVTGLGWLGWRWRRRRIIGVA